MVAGRLWLCLWTTRMRLLGLLPVAAGALAAWAAPTPDLLITGDGRHLVVVGDNGVPLLLRERAGDYVRQLLAEASGFDGDPQDLGTTDSSFCTRDSCIAAMKKGGKEWRLLAMRSATRIDWAQLTRACGEADIVVSDRRLPRGCAPRWLKLDAAALAAHRRAGDLSRFRAARRFGRRSRCLAPMGAGARRVRPCSTPQARSRPGR